VTTGDWKGYRLGTEAPLALFDLKSDPAESNDVSSKHPDFVMRMQQILAREHTPSPHWDAPAQPKEGPSKIPGAKNP